MATLQAHLTQTIQNKNKTVCLCVCVCACVRACVCVCVCCCVTTAGSLTHGVGGPEASMLHGAVGLETQPEGVGGGADGGRQGGATVFADQRIRLLSPVPDLEGGGRGLGHKAANSETEDKVNRGEVPQTIIIRK